MIAGGSPGRNARPADSFRRRCGTPGFTLIELTLVILVIGLLAILAAYTYRGLVTKARMTQAKTVLTHLFRTEAIYYANNDVYTDDVTLLDYDPVSYPYYQVSIVLDNGAQGYTGYATGIGPMTGDLWSITKDGTLAQDNTSPFK